MGPPPLQMVMVQKGTADGAYVFNAFLRKLVPSTQISIHPQRAETGMGRAVALWRMYQKFFKDKANYKDLEMVGYFGAADGSWFSMSDKPLLSMASLKTAQNDRTWTPPCRSRRRRSSCPARTSFPARRCASIRSSRKGVVDAFVGLTYGDLHAFKIDKYAKSGTGIPGGWFGASFSTFWNKKEVGHDPGERPEDHLEPVRRKAGPAQHCLGHAEGREASAIRENPQSLHHAGSGNGEVAGRLGAVVCRLDQVDSTPWASMARPRWPIINRRPRRSTRKSRRCWPANSGRLNRPRIPAIAGGRGARAAGRREPAAQAAVRVSRRGLQRRVPQRRRYRAKVSCDRRGSGNRAGTDRGRMTWTGGARRLPVRLRPARPECCDEGRTVSPDRADPGLAAGKANPGSLEPVLEVSRPRPPILGRDKMFGKGETRR